MARTPNGDILQPSLCSHSHPNPSHRQFGAPSFPNLIVEARIWLFMSTPATCVGNGAASHHFRIDHRPQGLVIAEQGRRDSQLRIITMPNQHTTTTVHFRLNPQDCTRAIARFWNKHLQITRVVAFGANQREPNRQSLDALVVWRSWDP